MGAALLRLSGAGDCTAQNQACCPPRHPPFLASSATQLLCWPGPLFWECTLVWAWHTCKFKRQYASAREGLC